MRTTTARLAMMMATFAGSSLLTGCVMVGYSSRGGFFIWPGSLAFVLLGLLLWLIFRNR